MIRKINSRFTIKSGVRGRHNYRRVTFSMSLIVVRIRGRHNYRRVTFSMSLIVVRIGSLISLSGAWDRMLHLLLVLPFNHVVYGLRIQ